MVQAKQLEARQMIVGKLEEPEYTPKYYPRIQAHPPLCHVPPEPPTRRASPRTSNPLSRCLASSFVRGDPKDQSLSRVAIGSAASRRQLSWQQRRPRWQGMQV